MFRKNKTIKFTLCSGGLFSATLNQDVQKQLRMLNIFPESHKEDDADILPSTTVTPENSMLDVQESVPVEVEVKSIMATISEPQWEKVTDRAQFIRQFLSLKSNYQDMGEFLDVFKQSFKNIESKQMIQWLTDGKENLEQLFENISQCPQTSHSMLAIFVAIFEIYCKERLKKSEIKSYGGWLASFMVKVYTSPEKIAAMNAAQLDILRDGVQGFDHRLNDEKSALFPYKEVLLENKSDTKKIIDQLLQLPLVKDYKPGYDSVVPEKTF